MTGMDGTTMLSYAGKLTPDQTWDLVHYVRVLQVAHGSVERKTLESAGGAKALATTPH
jgi:hypothetical protein